MEIKVEKQDKKCTIVLIGKLDAGTAPQLEEKLDYIPGGLEQLIFDMTELKYISSAGLRTLLIANDKLEGEGKVTIKGANEMVLDIFNITGFADLLNIQ
ncbi:MAG: STAS domain-containing protein [Ruminococcus sp.]|nr:STAS domain-containing protein [Ruminococcus sp.]